MFIETNPCTELWFLLHFLPTLQVKHYTSYEQLIPELQKYMPGYEKTKRYTFLCHYMAHLFITFASINYIAL